MNFGKQAEKIPCVRLAAISKLFGYWKTCVLGFEDNHLYVFSLDSVTSVIILTFQIFIDPIFVTISTLYNK